MLIRILVTIVGLSLAAANAAEFRCDENDSHVKGDTGILVIDRSRLVCGFKGQDDTKVFGIKTDDLVLKKDETITFLSDGTPPVTFKPPLEPGYFITGLHEPTIKFQFSGTDNTSSMTAQFIENKPDIPINGDNFNQLRIEPIGINTFNLKVEKTLESSIHFELIGSRDFPHSLLAEEKSMISVNTNRTVVVKTGPVLNICSGNHQAKEELSFDINGPDPKTAQAKYKCVNIFEYTTDQGHIEVDFANFLGLTDVDDEMLLDDGELRIKINKAQSDQYSKRVMVFKGKKLAVVYNSPRNISRTNIQFKLSIKFKKSGGIITKAGPLSIPASGQTHFVLRPQLTEFVSLETKGQLKGGSLTIKSASSDVITIPEGGYLPPVLGSNRQGSDLMLDFVSKAKVNPEISFKPTTTDCHGILYGTSGSISLSGGPKTCYWLLGAPKSRLIIDHTKLGAGGCLEIYSLSKSEPIFKSCDIGSAETLPNFALKQAYLKVGLASNVSEFAALIAPPALQYKKTSILNQLRMTSTGYPSSYGWSSDSDTYVINSANKSMTLSVDALDIRNGEKLLVDNKELNDISHIVGDIDISNKPNTTVILQRSMTTNDFSSRKGYNLVVSEFQQSIIADMSKNSITSRANLTSLLIKISAPQGKRLQYNITTKAAIKDSKFAIIDSRSVLGREVYGDERDNGSTTSNSLLITVVPLKSGAPTIPIIDVQYKIIECNKTTDHICDKDTRCVPADKLCKGRSYCVDESDLRVSCSSGPAPNPKIIEHGVGGFAVFLLCITMLVIGAISALYGPDLYKSLESRFRSGQYTTFTSTE